MSRLVGAAGLGRLAAAAAPLCARPCVDQAADERRLGVLGSEALRGELDIARRARRAMTSSRPAGETSNFVRRPADMRAGSIGVRPFAALLVRVRCGEPHDAARLSRAPRRRRPCLAGRGGECRHAVRLSRRDGTRRDLPAG